MPAWAVGLRHTRKKQLILKKIYMKFFVYTISECAPIVARFCATRKDSQSNRFFCGSSFSTQADAIQFAEDIERMKADAGELHFTIYAGKNRIYFNFREFKSL